MDKWNLSRVAMAACVLWMGAAVYFQFFSVDPDQYGFRSPEVERQIQNCGGSFEQRYKCKDTLIIQKERGSFMIWVLKMVLVFGPPAALLALVRFAGARWPERKNLQTTAPEPAKPVDRDSVLKRRRFPFPRDDDESAGPGQT